MTKVKVKCDALEPDATATIQLPTKTLVIVLLAVLGVGTAGGGGIGILKTLTAEDVNGLIKASPYTVDIPIEAGDVSEQIENECLYGDARQLVEHQIEKIDQVAKLLATMQVAIGRIETEVMKK